MAETINMPKLGFDMAEGTLVRWVKQVGEPIEKVQQDFQVIDDFKELKIISGR